MVIFFLSPNLCQLLPTQLYVFSLALETKNQDKKQKQTKKKKSVRQKQKQLKPKLDLLILTKCLYSIYPEIGTARNQGSLWSC